MAVTRIRTLTGLAALLATGLAVLLALAVAEDLERMRGQAPRELRRSIPALLDRQAMYKHLVEHHDMHEKNILYPALDRVTDETERAGLLRACRPT